MFAQVETAPAEDLYPTIARISRTFIDLPAPAVDEKIQETIAQVAAVIGADTVTVTQVSLDGNSRHCTHQWLRPGIDQMPGDAPVNHFPSVTA
jgi:hypothetical protein